MLKMLTIHVTALNNKHVRSKCYDKIKSNI